MSAASTHSTTQNTARIPLTKREIARAVVVIAVLQLVALFAVWAAYVIMIFSAWSSIGSEDGSPPALANWFLPATITAIGCWIGSGRFASRRFRSPVGWLVLLVLPVAAIVIALGFVVL